MRNLRALAVCLGLLTCARPASASEQAVTQLRDTLSPSVLFLAEGIQQAADTMLKQASGRARVRYARFRDGKMADRVARNWDFRIDGDKLRYDKYTPKDNAEGDEEFVVRAKYAFNGDAVSTFYYNADGVPAPAAHVRPRESRYQVKQSSYTGVTFHPRSLYIPQNLYRSGVESFPAYLAWRVSKGSEVFVDGDVATDSEVVLRIRHVSTGGIALEVKALIDIENGFLMPTCEYYGEGQLVGVGTRSYFKDPASGAMVIKSVKHERFRSGRDPWVQTIELDYDSINQPIPDEVFTLAGFDLPSGIKIYDTRFEGVSYRLELPSNLEVEWDGKLQSAGLLPVSDDGGRGRSLAASDTGTATQVALTVTSGQDAETGVCGATRSVALLLAGLAILAIAGCGIIWTTSRKRKRLVAE